jgi:hypothetical protein
MTSGKTGIFVIPSNNLTATPVFVTQAADAQEAAFAIAGTVTGNRITAESPARMMYTATGSDGKVHMYGLDLTSTSVPVPVQIGNTSLTAGQFCDSGSSAQNNLFQPSSLFVLIEISPTPGNCFSGTDVFEVINYSDSATTAPTVVSSIGPQMDFQALYHSTGALSGLLLQVGSNLDFFASSAFTSPTAIIQNLTNDSAADLINTTTAGQDLVGDSVVFYVAQDMTTSLQQLYRISATGTATSVYTSPAGGDLEANDTGDALSVFFSNHTGTNFTILRAPIAGGSAVALITEDTSVDNYGLIGSNGTVFAYYENPTSGGAGGTIKTISATAASPATVIGSVAGLTISAFSAEATPGTLSSTQILVNAQNSPFTGTRASEAFTFSGGITQALLANSSFQPFSQDLTGSVYQVRGITDTGSSAVDGGGSVNVYKVSNATVVPLTLSGGGAYAVPATGSIAVGAIGTSASDTIGVGAIFVGGPIAGIATDNASHLIVPISFANTTIDPF